MNDKPDEKVKEFDAEKVGEVARRAAGLPATKPPAESDPVTDAMRKGARLPEETQEE